MSKLTTQTKRHQLPAEVLAKMADIRQQLRDAEQNAKGQLQGLCMAEAFRAFGPSGNWRLTDDQQALELVHEEKK